jgi:hypothetical protein
MKKRKGEKGVDYKGPMGGGYFVLDEFNRPVTRRRGTPLGWKKDEDE